MRIVALVIAALVGCDRPATSQKSHPPVAPPRPGSISGIVTYMGRVPKHSDLEVLPPGVQVDRAKARSIQVDENGGLLANVYVAIETGPVGTHPTPSAPARLDQVGFFYEPRVLGVMKDQSIVIRNLDPELHNVHTRSEKNLEINQGQPKGGETLLKFSAPELGIRIQCDIHPWTTGWIHVSDHPFFEVTGSAGSFTISNVPPGEYEIIAWHERFIPLRAKVTVRAGKSTPLNFSFKVIQK